MSGFRYDVYNDNGKVYFVDRCWHCGHLKKTRCRMIRLTREQEVKWDAMNNLEAKLIFYPIFFSAGMVLPATVAFKVFENEQWFDIFLFSGMAVMIVSLLVSLIVWSFPKKNKLIRKMRQVEKDYRDQIIYELGLADIEKEKISFRWRDNKDILEERYLIVDHDAEFISRG